MQARRPKLRPAVATPHQVVAGEYLLLEQRVGALEQGIADLGVETGAAISELRQENNRNIGSLSNQITGLAAKFEDRSKIPWPALGVMLSFLTIIGGLVYWPISQAQVRLEAALIKLDNDMVPRSEWQQNQAVALARREDLQRFTDARLGELEKHLSTVDAAVVPRAEHGRQWALFDNQLANLQKQLDDAKAALGSTYSLRDALMQMQRRLDTLESRRTP